MKKQSLKEEINRLYQIMRLNENNEMEFNDVVDDTTNVITVIISHLSDIQEEAPNVRDKVNFIKDLIMNKLDDSVSITKDELDSISAKYLSGGSEDLDEINDVENDENDNLVDYVVPNWALSSLINGDDSGLEDEDIKKLDDFTREVESRHGNALFMMGDYEKDDLGFLPKNDIDNLGSDCTRLYIDPSK